MRAVVRGPEGDWEVAERPVPTPGPGEVLVRVRAAGLNHADLLMGPAPVGRDRYVPDGDGWRVPHDRVGFELAGEVVGTGEAVVAQAGGALAEVVAVDADQLVPLPGHLDWCEGAGLPSGVLTAYDALTRVAPVRAGERVLVTGATSGTGLLAVQVARALGADRVVATTRSRAHAGLLREQGAHEVLVGDPPEVVGEHDVVVDLVGGALLSSALRAVAVGGRVAQVGRLDRGAAEVDLELLARRRVALVGTTFRGRDRDELRGLVADLVASGVLGEVRPVLAGSVALGDAAAAAAMLRSPARPGKVVVEVRGDGPPRPGQPVAGPR